MYVESFSPCIEKVVYLDSKQNRRVDQLLTVLLRLARDKAFEQIQKLKKGKSSHQIKEINKRHGSAEEMMSSGILPIQCSENSWKVASQKTKEKNYIVTKVKQECACLLHCSSCHVCVHMFNCSCVDAHLHNTVCKHSHVVQVTSINQPSKVLPNELLEFKDLGEDQDLYEDLVFLQEIIMKILHIIHCMMKCIHLKALTQQNTLLVSFKALIGLLIYIQEKLTER